MQTYVLFLHDKRDEHPQFLYATVANKERALELAERELARSEHHSFIEVREGGTVHYRLKRDGEREYYPDPLNV